MPLNANQAQKHIIETYSKAWAEYQEVFNCGSLPTLSIISSKSGRAGTAYYFSHKVEININYAMIDPQAIIQTIYHELAHIIQFRLFPNAKQAHGREFRMILGMMRESTATYHRMDVVAAKKQKVLLIDLISIEDL